MIDQHITTENVDYFERYTERYMRSSGEIPAAAISNSYNVWETRTRTLSRGEVWTQYEARVGVSKVVQVYSLRLLQKSGKGRAK